MSLPDETLRPPAQHPPHSPVAATAYTVLPLALLLALIAWIYPVLGHHREPHRPAAPTTTGSPHP